MAAVQTAQRMTAEEFMALSVEPGDSRTYELVEGELVVNSPRYLHADVQRGLLLALVEWERVALQPGRVILPLDTHLDEANVFVPDLLWYRDGRVPEREDLSPYPLPDIAVEIRSPSTWRYDIGAKKSAYERHSLPELWLVDTAACEVLVFRRSTPSVTSFDIALELGRGDALESALLPGFSLPVADLYPE